MGFRVRLRVSERLAYIIVASEAMSSKLAEHGNAGSSRRARDALSHADREEADVLPLDITHTKN